MRLARAAAALAAAASLSLPVAALADGGLADALGAGVDVGRQDETGRVGFIGTQPGEAIALAPATPRQAAKGFVTDHAGAFGLAGPGAKVEVTETSETTTGTSVRLQQVEEGLPVLGGELIVNLDDSGDLLSVLGETSPEPRLAGETAVSATEAKELAVGTVAKDLELAPQALEASAPELSVYDPRLLGAPGPIQKARSAWVLDVSDREAVTTVDELVVVDAEFGVVPLHFSQIEQAKSRTVCDANGTETNVPCAAPVWTEAAQPGPQDADVAAAFNFAGQTYDFFAGRFGRDSLNGAGMQLKSTIDFCQAADPCPYRNAFWNGSQMVYGDGYPQADDVVGHELSHGVTDFTSQLFYYYQSGAINESLSDVFGEFIDQTNGSADDTAANRWKLAEGLPHNPGGIRNMQSPPLFNDPSFTGSNLYDVDADESDRGGVHTNSGVNNKAAYLMTDGTVAEPAGSFRGQVITGLGIAKVARLYYDVETTMLVSGSDYADLANALRQACANLAGAAVEGFSAGDCVQVDKALLATEMDISPAAAPTSDAPASSCSPGLSPRDLFFDNLENIGSGNWAHSAVLGGDAWYYPNHPNRLYATSGVRNIWGNDLSTQSDSSIAMTISIPLTPGSRLRFNHAYGFDASLPTNVNRYDGGIVEYSLDNGGSWTNAGPLFTSGGYNGTLTGTNPLAGQAAFSANSKGYGSSEVDLASLAGQSVRFRFRITTDNSLGDYGWFIDDVKIYDCTDQTAPETVITKGPRKVKAKKKAKFSFSANERAVFECRVDNKAFKSCSSPARTKKYKKGKHTFAVRAIDGVGLVDQTPAERKFKVKKKRRKR